MILILGKVVDKSGCNLWFNGNLDVVVVIAVGEVGTFL